MRCAWARYGRRQGHRCTPRHARISALRDEGSCENRFSHRDSLVLAVHAIAIPCPAAAQHRAPTLARHSPMSAVCDVASPSRIIAGSAATEAFRLPADPVTHHRHVSLYLAPFLFFFPAFFFFAIRTLTSPRGRLRQWPIVHPLPAGEVTAHEPWL